MVTWFILGFLAALALGAPAVVLLTNRLVARARRAERRQHESERLAQLGAMTGGLAHEIKNPLSTIGLNAQLIREGVAELDADQAERARLVKRADTLSREADRLRAVLEDFLEFAGALHVEPTPTDLNAIAEELGDFFAPQAADAGAHLRIEAAPAPALALADPRRAKQAALNLMLNAVQVMREHDPPDGRRKELILRVERRVEAGEPVVVLHVIDTGPGVREDRLREIFKPYVSMRAGGAGLGLAITARIMAEHRGRIGVHSAPGRGSDFSLVFPAAVGVDRPAQGG
ncbi:MAG: two-component sensor histidine kinase [Planctomycetota bacterium]|nr:MAG: two-component sensor histidine kinase [Planctomycetota bacterium]